ncbi:hypothetical protein [Acinetobacter nosocomialis]|uniref:hypothetical protein n=1 Tax=Acinetobacter nosocomialis TaxID=106654 RepID=UPI0024DE5D31|nr:hypothetical protein [Acinetobacter nosocomialis]
MTVPISDRLSQLYVGNGTNTRFDFTFRVFQQEDATGISVRKKGTTDFETVDPSTYDVFLNPDDMGGYIIFKTPPVSGTFFYVAGETPLDQLLDITNYDNFYPDAIERAFDKLTALLQEWATSLSQEKAARIAGFLLLKNGLDQEIIDRIAADTYLQTQVSSNTQKADQLFKNLAAEILNRIAGDRDAKLFAKEYTDFMITQVDENMPIFDGVSDRVVIAFNGDTQSELNKSGKRGSSSKYDAEFATDYKYGEGDIVTLEDGSRVKSKIDNNPNDPNTNMENWEFIDLAHERTYAPVLGSAVRFIVNPIKASFLFGLSDPTPLDDLERDFFRGLSNKNSWAVENLGVGSSSRGRNGCPKAYLSSTDGHDCITYGVVSHAFGAACCTGNPDEPEDGTNWGYGSLAGGRNSWARGKKALAFGEWCDALSRYCVAMGYKAIAGPSDPEDPNYLPDGVEGAAAYAHGYEVEAHGNFALALGAFVEAYNGAHVLGRGLFTEQGIKPLEVSKRGVGIGYNVDKPTIFCKEGDGISGNGAWIGFNTELPMSRYDYRCGESDTITHVIESVSGNGLLANEVKGLMADGTYKSLHNVIVTHPNAGQPYALVQYRLNGVEYLTVDQSRKAKFNGAVEAAGAGFLVAGKRVVGGQLPAIAKLPNDASPADVIAKMNEIIDGVTNHGLFAPS